MMEKKIVQQYIYIIGNFKERILRKIRRYKKETLIIVDLISNVWILQFSRKILTFSHDLRKKKKKKIIKDSFTL